MMYENGFSHKYHTFNGGFGTEILGTTFYPFLLSWIDYSSLKLHWNSGSRKHRLKFDKEISPVTKTHRFGTFKEK